MKPVLHKKTKKMGSGDNQLAACGGAALITGSFDMDQAIRGAKGQATRGIGR
ncbi:MAG TPA: hypothetical protein VFG03_13505 [Telluria sp.]|nr:hypothetical protein [Telluria sp.]